MFTKQIIFDSLDGYFSKVGIKLIDDEWRLVGKWCEIVPLEDGNWDIWFHDVRNPSAPLNGNRVNNIKSIIPREWPLIELTGEMWVQVPLEELITISPLLRGVCGVRKKQTYSEEIKTKLLRNFD